MMQTDGMKTNMESDKMEIQLKIPTEILKMYDMESIGKTAKIKNGYIVLKIKKKVKK